MGLPPSRPNAIYIGPDPLRDKLNLTNAAIWLRTAIGAVPRPPNRQFDQPLPSAFRFGSRGKAPATAAAAVVTPILNFVQAFWISWR